MLGDTTHVRHKTWGDEERDNHSGEISQRMYNPVPSATRQQGERYLS